MRPSMVIDLRVQPATTVGGKRSSDTTTIDDHRIPAIIGYHDHRRSSDTTTIDDHCDSMWLRPSTAIDLREHNDRKWQRSSIDGHRFGWAAHHHSKWQTCIAPIDGHDLREHKDRSSAATIIDFRLSISELLVGYLHHIDGTKKKQPTRV